jgi:hypothetical protein
MRYHGFAHAIRAVLQALVRFSCMRNLRTEVEHVFTSCPCRISPGAWTTLEQDFARHPPTYIVDVRPDPKSAQYPVKNFPILAKLLAERYQPVAHTAEGVIYRMR